MRGGKRAGAGNKTKAKTKSICFRDEVTKIDSLKIKYPKQLNKLFKEWTKNLLS